MILHSDNGCLVHYLLKEKTQGNGPFGTGYGLNQKCLLEKSQNCMFLKSYSVSLCDCKIILKIQQHSMFGRVRYYYDVILLSHHSFHCYMVCRTR